jgi:C1A family cysteine protease
MEELDVVRAMGWLPDYPDFRDYTPEQQELPSKLKALGTEEPISDQLARTDAQAPVALLPPVISLRQWMSPVEDQGSIGSCTAQAGAGLIEYFERRAFNRHTDASRLFLYKVTRNLLHWTGDTGAFLRTTMGAMVLFGVPPEEYWKYRIADYDKEPSAFCYAFGQNYQTIQYYRYDPPGTPRDALLARIKTNIASGLPSMFGFTVYSSISQANQTGAIPFPAGGEAIQGGHAVVAAGYDDNRLIKNTSAGGTTTKGALLIRNSWGTGWGQGGYGWLPYEYVVRGLAVDWWSVLKKQWVNTGHFDIATTVQAMAEAPEYGIAAL